MDNELFKSFVDFVVEAFKTVVYEIGEHKYVECEKENLENGKKYIAVIGIVGGKNKGRIVFETGEEPINKVIEDMNYEINTTTEKYLSVGEFVNILCGRAVTLMNNKNRGIELRLTPPAVFAGLGLNVSTPNIKSEKVYFKSDYGIVAIDIGFEGE